MPFNFSLWFSKALYSVLRMERNQESASMSFMSGWGSEHQSRREVPSHKMREPHGAEDLSNLIEPNVDRSPSIALILLLARAQVCK